MLLVSLMGEVLPLGPHHTLVDEVNFVAYVLVDLRSPGSYAEEHIMGAINIPYEELEDYIGVLPYEHLIVFYDEDDRRSLSAVEKMLEGGYQEYYVVNLHGGLPAWRASR
jgi:rhodanese-related sulfurtransferase